MRYEALTLLPRQPSAICRILIAPTSGAEAGARIKSDFQKWAKVVKAAGMHVD